MKFNNQEVKQSDSSRPDVMGMRELSLDEVVLVAGGVQKKPVVEQSQN